jgi:hypothetical protein
VRRGKPGRPGTNSPYISSHPPLRASVIELNTLGPHGYGSRPTALLPSAHPSRPSGVALAQATESQPTLHHPPPVRGQRIGQQWQLSASLKFDHGPNVDALPPETHSPQPSPPLPPWPYYTDHVFPKFLKGIRPKPKHVPVPCPTPDEHQSLLSPSVAPPAPSKPSINSFRRRLSPPLPPDQIMLQTTFLQPGFGVARPENITLPPPTADQSGRYPEFPSQDRWLGRPLGWPMHDSSAAPSRSLRRVRQSSNLAASNRHTPVSGAPGGSTRDTSAMESLQDYSLRRSSSVIRPPGRMSWTPDSLASIGDRPRQWWRIHAGDTDSDESTEASTGERRWPRWWRRQTRSEEARREEEEGYDWVDPEVIGIAL